MGVSSENNL